VSECATITGTTTVTVPRPPDLAYYEGSTEVKPSTSPSNAIDLNCTKTQYGVLLEARQDFGQIGGNAVFKWTIPSTWIATNAGTKKGEISENNISYDVYEGVWQNTLYVKQKADAPNQINGGQFWAKVTTCSTEVDVVIKQNKSFKRFEVKSKQPYTVEAQDFTSCTSSFLINPAISGEFRQPINLTWDPNYSFGSFASTSTKYTVPGTGAATYTANVNGFQPVMVRGVDDAGCVSLYGSTASANGYQNSSIRVGIQSQNALGWNSGVLPTVPQTVPAAGNKIVGLSGGVYYIGTNGLGYYYEFSNDARQWLIKSIPSITNGKTNDNSLAVSTRGAVFYYLNNAGSISRIATPYLLGAISTIVPGTAGAVGGLEVENVVGSPSRGTLYFRGANNYIYKYNPATDAQASVFVAEPTVYDIRAYNGRVYYITQINGNPQLKYRDAGTNASTIIYSGSIWNPTEIDVNTQGDVFFVMSQFLQVVPKTTSGYGSIVQFIPNRSETYNGNFTINQSTGTLYAASNDRLIYTYRNENNFWKSRFATTGIDNVVSSLYFASPNLLYVNGNGIIYNLYYFPQCPPAFFRKGDEETNTNISLNNGIYPNPFQDALEVNVSGQGEARLELCDLSGRVISSIAYYFAPTQLNTSGLNKGMYLCRIMQDGKQVFVAKVQK
jgi:hypothetical protein